MRIRLSRRAETDLVEITDFIALDSPERASEFEDELLEHARNIAQAPQLAADTHSFCNRREMTSGDGSCPCSFFGSVLVIA